MGGRAEDLEYLMRMVLTVMDGESVRVLCRLLEEQLKDPVDPPLN